MFDTPGSISVSRWPERDPDTIWWDDEAPLDEPGAGEAAPWWALTPEQERAWLSALPDSPGLMPEEGGDPGPWEDPLDDPRAFSRSTVQDLHRLPGLESLAAVEDLLGRGEAVDRLPVQDLLALVTATHHAVGWMTVLRCRATAALRDHWRRRPILDPDTCGPGDARYRRLIRTRRHALRRWNRSTPRAQSKECDQDDLSGLPAPYRSPTDSLAAAYTAAEVSLACAVTHRTVHAWLATADRLGDPRLPQTTAAARDGLLDPAKLTEILRATSALPDAVVEVIDAVVSPRAMLPDPAGSGRPGDVVETELRTVRDLKDALHEQIHLLDPDGAAARADAARRTRRVVIRRLDDVMGQLQATLPHEDLARIKTLLDAEAATARTNGDSRTLPQLRADVLTAIMCTTQHIADPTAHQNRPDTTASTTASPSPRPQHRPSRPARPAEALLLIPLETLHGRGTPGHLTGYGPLSADQTRAMATDLLQNGSWRCAAIDDTHHTLLGLGRRTYTTSYRATTHLRRFTDTLYGNHCAFPGCTSSAAACDWDHLIPQPHGATCACNGLPLCRRCHRLKTTGLITVTPSANADHPHGTLIWTTQTGRHYLHRPTALTPRHPQQLAEAMLAAEPPPPF